MLIQTTERAHARRCAELGGYWPHNALDLWWRCARRAPDRELLALSMLEQWRKHATFRLSSHLVVGDMIGFLDDTEASNKAKCLDRLSVSALAACAVHRRLRANYTGDAFAFGATPTGVPFLGDTSDCSALLGAGTQGVHTVYDQSGSGFGNYTQVSGTNRPRIVNSGTIDVTANGVPTMVFNPTALNQALNGPTTSAYGLSGSPSLLMCGVAQITGNYLFALGRGSNFNAFRVTSVGSISLVEVNGAGTARTTFTNNTASSSKHCSYAAALATGATVGTATCAQDGVALSVLSTGLPLTSLSLISAITRWGCVSDSVGAAAGHMNGKSNFLVLIAGSFAASDVLTLSQEMARHV